MKKAARMAAIDFLVFAVFLLTFAYFHHVRVEPMAPTVLQTPVPATPAPATPVPEELPSVPALSEAVATPEPDDLLGGKYADRFTATTVSSERAYTSKDISLTVDRISDGRVTYYLADVYVRDISCIRTAVALEYGKSNRMQAIELASLSDAIVSITGDYFAFRKTGNVAVRNGREWIRKEPLSSDILVLYYDGTMEVYYADSFPDLDAIYARGPYQIWCFGPVLVDGGAVPSSYNTTVASANPRSAIGYFEPGHYCLVLVDGRQKNYSLGMTMRELSDLFMELGCELAFNLDGGDTAMMTYGDALMSHPDGKPRDVSDIIYIGEPVDITTLYGD